MRRRRLGGSTGDQFPRSVPRACSLSRAGGNNTPQPANFIFYHFLSFSPCPPETQQSATSASHGAPLQACEAQIGCSGLSEVSELLLLPGRFSLFLFFICHVPGSENKPRHFGSGVFFSPCVQLEFKVGSREGRGRHGRQLHRYSVGLKRHKEVKKILYELLNSLVSSPKVAMSFRCSVNQIQ